MEMTKAKYPRNNKAINAQTFSTSLQQLSGTLDNWLKCREETIQAQIRLLQSCRNDEEINRYKTMGLLNFAGTSFLGRDLR